MEKKNQSRFKTKNKIKLFESIEILSMFRSVISVVFQIIFCAEIHANNVFYFLKIIFDINISKRLKIYKLY